MSTANSIKTGLIALIAGGFLTACGDVPTDKGIDVSSTSYWKNDAPLASGNTFDYWNKLEKISPEAAVINISYRYLYQETFPLTVKDSFEGRSWMFVRRRQPVPQRALYITVRNDVETFENPVGRVLVFGRHQFVSEVFCVSKSDTKNEKTVMAYANHMWSKSAEVSDDLLVHRYIASEPELENQRLEIVHAEDIVRTGYKCSDLGNVKEPSDSIREYLKEIRENGERSFEIVG